MVVSMLVGMGSSWKHSKMDGMLFWRLISVPFLRFENCLYYLQVATALLVVGSTLTFWIPPFASTSRTQASFKVLGYSYHCRRLTDGSFQLSTFHVMSTLFNWSSHGGQNKDGTLLQRSQRCHKGEFRHVNISARQRSLWCGQNLCEPFLRAILPDRALERWRTTGRQKGS